MHFFKGRLIWMTFKILTDISLDVYSGEYISIIGPNGSGKSTLFNMQKASKLSVY